MWSDYLNQSPHGDSHDLPGGAILTVIQDKTAGFGFGGRSSSLRGMTTFAHFVFTNLREHRIERQFRLVGRYVLASRAETESPEFQSKFPNSYGYVVLSSVGFNAQRTEALFYIEHVCGLCGSGRYVLMRKNLFGVWKTVEEHYTWVS